MGCAREDIATSRGASQGPKGKEAGMWKLGGIWETCRNGAPGKRGWAVNGRGVWAHAHGLRPHEKMREIVGGQWGELRFFECLLCVDSSTLVISFNPHSHPVDRWHSTPYTDEEVEAYLCWRTWPSCTAKTTDAVQLWSPCSFHSIKWATLRPKQWPSPPRTLSFQPCLLRSQGSLCTREVAIL